MTLRAARSGSPTISPIPYGESRVRAPWRWVHRSVPLPVGNSHRELGRTGATRRRAQRFPGSDSKETIMTIAKPNMHPFILATCAAALLAACNDKNEAAEDKLERAAETSATVAGPLPAALGLSEAQLLEADIVRS